jgi:ribose transport system substrate-binding protein
MKVSISRGSARRNAGIAFASATLAIGLTACGGGTGSASSGSTADDAEGFKEAKALVADFREAPESIGITEPVGKPIPSDKLIVLVGAGKSGQGTILSYEGFNEAAEILGWEVKEIQPDLPTPELLQQALNQAIQLKPDAVAIAAVPTAAVASQLAELKKMGVPVISTTGPDPTGGDLTMQLMGTEGLSEKATAIADQVLADMGEPGTVGIVGIEGYQIIQDYSEAFKKEIKRLCPSCTIEQTLLGLTSLATTAGSDTVNWLRANPDIKALFVSYDGLGTNLFPAAKSVGVQLPKTYSLALLPESLATLDAGTLTATTPLDFAELGWRMADTLARVFTGQTEAAQEIDAQYARPVIWSSTYDNVPAEVDGGFPSVVEDYRAQYQELWGK